MADTLSVSPTGPHPADASSTTSQDDTPASGAVPPNQHDASPSDFGASSREQGAAPPDQPGTPLPAGGIWSSSTNASPAAETTTETATDPAASPSAPPPAQPGTAHRPPPESSTTTLPKDPYARPIHARSGYPYATWWRRLAAFTIDGVLVSMAWVFFWVLFGGSFSSGRIAYLLSDVAGGAYFTILTAGHRGQTPGMRATGIAVRHKLTGGAIGYPKAILRSLLMSLLAAPGFVFFLIDCLVPLWQKDRQALHDMAAGTVVVEVRNGMAVAPSAAGTTGPAPGNGTPAGNQSAVPATIRRGAHALLRFLRTRSERFWITGGGAVVACVLVFVTVRIATAMVSAAYSPTNAAIDYLKALSAKDVAAMATSSGVVTPDGAGADVTVLLSSRDIARELGAPGNGIGKVSDIVVTSSKASGDTAVVTLQYIAGNQVHTVTDTLIKSSANSSGWAVQVTPARLDIDVPAGVANVQVDGMSVRADGQMAHVELYPSLATLSTPPTAIWQATDQSVDATHPAPGGDPQEVTLLPELSSAASSSAKAAVANQITACMASASLTPTNCPNTDSPSTIRQGDTYSSITWSATGDPTSGLTVSADKAGRVTVAGSVTLSVTYTDTTRGDGFVDPISTQQYDGPTTVNYSYPLTWNGSGWDLGTIQIQSPNGGSA